MKMPGGFDGRGFSLLNSTRQLHIAVLRRRVFEHARQSGQISRHFIAGGRAAKYEVRRLGHVASAS